MRCNHPRFEPYFLEFGMMHVQHVCPWCHGHLCYAEDTGRLIGIVYYAPNGPAPADDVERD